jgi:hypothetical protein
MYCCWRSNYQEGKVGIPLTGLTLPYVCACPKTGPGFPTFYVLVPYLYSNGWVTLIICNYSKVIFLTLQIGLPPVRDESNKQPRLLMTGQQWVLGIWIISRSYHIPDNLQQLTTVFRSCRWWSVGRQNCNFFYGNMSASYIFKTFSSASRTFYFFIFKLQTKQTRILTNSWTFCWMWCFQLSVCSDTALLSS